MQFEARNAFQSSLFALHYLLKLKEMRCHQGMCHLPRWMGAGWERGRVAGPALTFHHSLLALLKCQPSFHGSWFYGCRYLTLIL